MEITGKIKLINDEQTFGASGFRKREVVLTTEEQYPQMLLVEFVQDKCDLLNAFKVDDKVTIGINLRGKEWINPEGVAKYFNAIQGWRITSDSTPLDNMPDKVEPEILGTEEPDDLPF